MRTLQSKRRIPGRDRRGAAAVELALILPLLITIVLGAVDFGRFAHSYVAVTNAARAGAGFASMNPYTTASESVWASKLRTSVQEEMQQVIDGAPDFSETDLLVGTTRTFDAGNLWRVRVTVTFPFETIVPWPTIPNRVDLTRAVEIRGIR